VKDFNGEGISWQIAEHVTVRDCEISGSGNTGLHPGNGSPFSLIENNNIHHNDMDGLFICWSVYDSRVAGNNGKPEGGYGFSINSPASDLLLTENQFLNSSST